MNSDKTRTDADLMNNTAVAIISYAIFLKFLFAPAHSNEIIFRSWSETYVFFLWLCVFIYGAILLRIRYMWPQSLLLNYFVCQILTQSRCPEVTVCIS